MDTYGLPVSPLYDVQVFKGNSTVAAQTWFTYMVPRGKSMLSIYVLGGGGGGGSGVVGANSVSAGGGGGGSGGQTVAEIPIALLPMRLYISVAQGKTGAGIASYVSTQPNATVNHVLVYANGGSAGTNGAGATGGAGGTAAGVATAANSPLGSSFWKAAVAGQAGAAGGGTNGGSSITLPVTGLRVTGGAGGGGLAAAATNGQAGGNINGKAAPSYFISNIAGTASAAATTPPVPGLPGFAIPEAGFYWYGGTGGGSTHGSATGAGLVQASGGDGGIGCGGGGMGGALTTSTAAALSRGGDGIVIITAW